MKSFAFFISVFFVGTVTFGSQSLDAVAKAKILFERITGTPILTEDPRLKQMADLIEKGQDEGAASIATQDPYFYQVTVKNMAASMANRSETPYAELDDFQATFIGAVRDGLDARTLLTGNYLYVPNPKLGHPSASRRDNYTYQTLDEASDLGQGTYYSRLIKQEPQWSDMRDHAGLLTTRAWAQAHYDAGTNRRAVVYSFQEFLCSPIASWKVANLPDDFVGRDVSRAPGKDPTVYRTQCATCHAGMDAMRGAFAYLDYVNGGLVELPQSIVAPKYSRNSQVYPQGYVTQDDTYVNRIARYQPSLGFDPQMLQGKGINEFGNMLANSQAFKECMVSRVFTATCNRSPSVTEGPIVKSLAQRFSMEGYNFKKLFSEVAVEPACTGSGDVPTTAGVKNFRSIYYSLIKVTGVKPSAAITDNYKSVMPRLPKDGRASEISSSVELAAQSLAGLFCGEFAKNSGLNAATVNDQEAMLQALSNRIYQRPLMPHEDEVLKTLLASVSSQKNKVFLACTAMASSIDFLGRK